MDEELKKMLVKILENQEEFKAEIRKHTEAITSLDEKIMQRTEALFDGYKINSEKIDELTDKIDDLRFDVNNLGIKTLKSENKILELDRRLAK
ncbi:hypothetical protein HMPREF1982_02307 [Clostridiales bacterium oral taxon 876 str. F0540]|nr:hypothetical protein HMPREF1982_02307 [Clostridiales bacterium oral taxon 876 str. F0540]